MELNEIPCWNEVYFNMNEYLLQILRFIEAATKIVKIDLLNR